MRAFLFGGERGTNAYHFTLRAAGFYEEPLGALCRFERPGQFLRVGRFFGNLLFEGGEFSGGDDRCGMVTGLDLTLVGPLEGGADSDDPVGARHLQLEVCIVGDGHELHVERTAWKVPGNPTTSKVRVFVL